MQLESTCPEKLRQFVTEKFIAKSSDNPVFVFKPILVFCS